MKMLIGHHGPHYNLMCCRSPSTLMLHLLQKVMEASKRGAETISPPAAASIDLWPTYIHARLGMRVTRANCDNTFLFLEWGGREYRLFTCHTDLKTGALFCLAAISCNTQRDPGKLRVWEEEPVHKQRSSPPVSRTNSDGQLTHSSGGRRGRRQHILPSHPEGLLHGRGLFLLFSHQLQLPDSITGSETVRRGHSNCVTSVNGHLSVCTSSICCLTQVGCKMFWFPST